MIQAMISPVRIEMALSRKPSGSSRLCYVQRRRSVLRTWCCESSLPNTSSATSIRGASPIHAGIADTIHARADSVIFDIGYGRFLRQSHLTAKDNQLYAALTCLRTAR